MKFGFIAHPTSVPLKRHVKLVDWIERISKDQQNGYRPELWKRKNLLPFVDFGRIESPSGADCEGLLWYLPLTAHEILTDRQQTLRRVLQGIDELHAAGAEIVGLGGATSIIGQRGESTARKASLPVTSGNSLTAYSGYKALLNIFDRLGVAAADARVAIVGYPGSIALSVANLLLAHGCRLLLVHRRKDESDDRLLSHLASDHRGCVSMAADIEEAYADTQFYVAATSAGSVIDSSRLKPGSVVIDMALPRDVIETPALRDDVLIVDGGYMSATEQVKLSGQIMEMAPTQQINGCVAETMVLALEKRAECYSIGQYLDSAKVLEIGRLAEHHGLYPTPLASYGERIDEDLFTGLAKFHRPVVASPAVRELIKRGPAAEGAALRAEVFDLYRRHINPVMADFLKMNHIDRVFVRAKGCTLIDSEGREHLDFVAGYGCLNIGHNHPAVVACIKDFLDESRPAFVQYVSVPMYTTLLAEKLCSIAPGRMERVFFSNSGAEAVEAALKLARAATGKSRIVYAENSFHGKTLGALSVTGREKHRAQFYPLLPDCTEVPFGDLDALKAELERGDVAAFIIEPIQGEGGVRLAPDGYLPGARRLCSEMNALLILDEIQTGFGRTGRLFASEWEGVDPDVLCLAKSLSGSLVPIGATLSRSDVWQAAYGTSDRFALHTSTFGGGNLASAAGLSAIEVIQEENLPARALEIGGPLKQELQAIAKDYPFVKEVRGRGLMLAIEFASPFDDAVSATVENFAGRLPGRLQRLYRFMPDKARDSLNSALREIESALEEFFCLRFVTKLGQEHNILTFMTANNNKVLRIQPPLVLRKDEADRFVSSFRDVCEDMSTFLD